MNTADFFSDADAGDTVSDRLYRIENKPSWFLIETKDGFVLDDDGTTDNLDVKYEVLQKVEPSNEKDYEFTVSLYASDGEEESTRPVVMKFRVDDNNGLPLVSRPYPVDQDEGGNFRAGAKDGPYNNRLDVGPRREVTHTVTFGTTGFVFANVAAEKLQNDDLLSSGVVTVVASDIYYQPAGGSIQSEGTAATLPTGTQDEGTDFFLIKSTSAVTVVQGTGGDVLAIGDPTRVPFMLKERAAQVVLSLSTMYGPSVGSQDQQDQVVNRRQKIVPMSRGRKGHFRRLLR